MKIFLGADHGGFALKEKAKQWLMEWGFDYQDCGAVTLNPEDDYPQLAFKVARRVAAITSSRVNTSANKTDLPAVGILFCRSSGGMIIAANKIRGIRAVGVNSLREVVHAREHNDANVISLAGDRLDEATAKTLLETFLKTNFTHQPRHVRRIKQIEEYETNQGR